MHSIFSLISKSCVFLAAFLSNIPLDWRSGQSRAWKHTHEDWFEEKQLLKALCLIQNFVTYVQYLLFNNGVLISNLVAFLLCDLVSGAVLMTT